jgi:hypothetical protein
MEKDGSIGEWVERLGAITIGLLRHAEIVAITKAS